MFCVVLWFLKMLLTVYDYRINRQTELPRRNYFYGNEMFILYNWNVSHDTEFLWTGNHVFMRILLDASHSSKSYMANCLYSLRYVQAMLKKKINKNNNSKIIIKLFVKVYGLCQSLFIFISLCHEIRPRHRNEVIRRIVASSRIKEIAV